mgnify:CR=1 FL=1
MAVLQSTDKRTHRAGENMHNSNGNALNAGSVQKAAVPIERGK